MKTVPSLSIFSALLGLGAAQCSVDANFEVTFYGYPDNSPSGAGTAYNCGGRNNIAGGTGTYDDPVSYEHHPFCNTATLHRNFIHFLLLLLQEPNSIQVTFATAPGEFNECEIIYIPLLTKYGRFEDECAQCSKQNPNTYPTLNLGVQANISSSH
jgi:hypothetical protein